MPIRYSSLGDLVVSTVSDQGGGLDTAAPIVLHEFGSGQAALREPGRNAGAAAKRQRRQSAISGEYGSASEGFLQNP